MRLFLLFVVWSLYATVVGPNSLLWYFLRAWLIILFLPSSLLFLFSFCFCDVYYFQQNPSNVAPALNPLLLSIATWVHGRHCWSSSDPAHQRTNFFHFSECRLRITSHSCVEVYALRVLEWRISQHKRYSSSRHPAQSVLQRFSSPPVKV